MTLAPTRFRTAELLSELSPMKRRHRRPSSWVRVALTTAVLASAVFSIIELTSGDGLTEEDLRVWVKGFGAWGPAAFLLAFATFGSLLVPTTALTVVGATLFGSLAGFVYSLVGAFCAAMLGFSAARTLGRKAVTRLLERRGGTMADLDARLAEHGFSTAFFMRLLYLPNGLINIACGVSAIPSQVYALATLLGLTPIIFAVAFITGGARRALLAGDMRALLQPEVLLSVALFGACISIPLVHMMVKNRRRSA
jgi:uncharacterized membrane protein YdjX (TVP38/TMEM64 family)